MDFRYSPEQDINQSWEASSFAYLHYRADIPAKCDLSFRKFVTTSIFEGAILVPVRSGPGRKLTLEGVVKVAATSALPVTTQYKDTVLSWTPITEFIFERYRKESATKIYFRGFPLEATQAQISSVFSEHGPLQYVYIMCDSSQKRRTNKQGYIIYESRASVERLFAVKGGLHFNGYPIHIEEYKSKNSNMLKCILSRGSENESANAAPSPSRSRDYFSIPLQSQKDTPIPCARSPYQIPGTRDCSFAGSFTALRAGGNKKSTFASLTNINYERAAPKNSRLRQYLRFGLQVEENCQVNNLRFNQRSRPLRRLDARH